MGSPFASLRVSDPIALPFDPPNTITVRKLTGRHVELAQAAHLRSLVAGQSARGWEAKLRRSLDSGDEQQVRAVLADPLNGYDRHTVVAFGLVSWTYANANVEKDGDPHKPTPKQIDDLDDEALEFIATEVMRLTKPHLFQTIEEAEAARKNG